ncbi:LacI family DNA-binding transcriptional regulator [Angustibacter luteus]|uniref:LacI family DNA-binding transcriptional regulator n=1 Tax=Angustibacter luteus TaxID=658456 RepID=A0ABW1JFA5_9ACTN
MPIARVRDVAALAGVSPGTVSNALNHPAKVTPETLSRIQSAIDELGFVRNDAARQLRAGTNRSVGLVVLDVANPFFTDVAHGVEDELGPADRPLILGNSAQSAARELTYLTLFEEQRISGLLITPAGNVVERLRRLRDRGTAVVLVDRLSRTRDFASVSVDDRLGGRLAAEHLLDVGRRRIAFIGGPLGITQVKTRLKAAQDAVARFGSGELVVMASATMDATAGRLAAEEFLALPRRRRPDAVFAANDLVALGVLQALTMAGVRVPDDVAIIGYDDIDFAASAAIPLSSVRQPAHEMGAAAARILLEVIADPDQANPRHTTFKPELVARASTRSS